MEGVIEVQSILIAHLQKLPVGYIEDGSSADCFRPLTLLLEGQGCTSSAKGRVGVMQESGAHWRTKEAHRAETGMPFQRMQLQRQRTAERDELVKKREEDMMARRIAPARETAASAIRQEHP
ncbi:unnamed protein product [Eretmochelys imbricata]